MGSGFGVFDPRGFRASSSGVDCVVIDLSVSGRLKLVRVGFARTLGPVCARSDQPSKRTLT